MTQPLDDLRPVRRVGGHLPIADPGTGEFLGNYPQAFSHIGVISSGINLARSLAERSKQ